MSNSVYEVLVSSFMLPTQLHLKTKQNKNNIQPCLRWSKRTYFTHLGKALLTSISPSDEIKEWRYLFQFKRLKRWQNCSRHQGGTRGSDLTWAWVCINWSLRFCLTIPNSQLTVVDSNTWCWPGSLCYLP